MSIWQYQDYASPTMVIPRPSPTEYWYAELPVLPPILATLPTASMAATFFADGRPTIIPPNQLLAGWYQPLSEPVLPIPHYLSEWGGVWPVRFPGPPEPTATNTPIRRMRRSPHLTEEQFLLFVSRFQLELQTGVGLSSGQGSDPMLMLRVSRNGGKTWGNEVWVSAGKIGQYTRRAIWRRVGRGRDLVFEVSMSDPVLWAIVEATVDVTKGTS